MNNKEIHQFIAMFKQKDNEIIASFYEKNYPKALSFILKNSGRESECKDIYQDAFVALWEKIDQLDFTSIDDVQGYFYRMVQFKWYSKLRQNKKEQTKLLEVEQPEDLSFDEEKEARIAKLEKRLAEMGEKCQQILKSFYFENKSYDNIAQEMNYSAEVLKTMKYRCIKKLKAIF